MKPSGPALVFVGGVFLLFIYRFYFTSNDCSNYQFLFDWILVDCMFLKTYPFFLGCWIYWHIIVHCILLQCFVFLWYQLRLLFFTWVLYPFLGSVANGSSILFTLSISFLISSFPYSSVGKESTCNARDPGSIPGSGRSAGEGIGYPGLPLWLSW